MKKMFTLILACLMLLPMVACGKPAPAPSVEPSAPVADQPSASIAPTESPAEDVEITFWHAMNGVNEEAIAKITADFMAQNPNIKVTLMNQGGYRDLFDKLMASAKAKQLPNIAQIYSNRLSFYVSKDLSQDLTAYMDDPEIGLTPEDRADIPAMFMDDCIWGDGQYAMPFNKSMMVLYYNEGMLKDAGIEVPTTWEAWADAAKALTKDENGDGEPEVYGMVFANGLSTDIAPWLRQAGGATMNEETNELYFNTPETKEAVEFLNSMFQAKTARLAGEDKNSNVPVQQGRAAMCVASTSALPYIEADTMEGITIRAAALPGHQNNAQLYYGTNVTVFSTGTEAQKRASWNYIKFLTSTENTAYFAAQTGYIPVRKSAKTDPVFAPVMQEKPIKQLCFDNMDVGFQGTRNIGGINALDALGDQLDLVFGGEKSVDDALKDAQVNGEKAMAEAQNN